MKRVLAFDFGASSGRAILGAYEGGRLTYKEVHRFENNPPRTGRASPLEFCRPAE